MQTQPSGECSKGKQGVVMQLWRTTARRGHTPRGEYTDTAAAVTTTKSVLPTFRDNGAVAVDRAHEVVVVREELMRLQDFALCCGQRAGEGTATLGRVGGDRGWWHGVPGRRLLMTRHVTPHRQPQSDGAGTDMITPILVQADTLLCYHHNITNTRTNVESDDCN